MGARSRFQLRARLGAALRGQRQARGLTQGALANLIDGMTIKRVSEIERGQVNVTLDTVEKLAAALHLDAPDLFRFAVAGAPQARTVDDVSLVVAKVNAVLTSASREKLRKLRLFLDEIL